MCSAWWAACWRPRWPLLPVCIGLVAAKQNITEADCDSFMYAVDPEMGMPGGFAVNGGVYTLSDKPGLGIDIDF